MFPLLSIARIRSIILLTSSFLVISVVNGQEIIQSNGQNFVNYDLEHEVSVTFQDSKGYLWVGTRHGVARWDGYTFKYFKEYFLDSSGFKGALVTTINEDPFGNIWVGTMEKGLNIFTYGKGFQNYSIEKNGLRIPENFVASTVNVDDGKLLLSTRDKIYLITLSENLEESEFKVFNFPLVARLIKTKNGRIFI